MKDTIAFGETERWHTRMAELLEQAAQQPGADDGHLLMEASRHRGAADSIRLSMRDL